eukprot:12917026-Prorocentrum_lima.AAC.1
MQPRSGRGLQPPTTSASLLRPSRQGHLGWLVCPGVPPGLAEVLWTACWSSTCPTAAWTPPQ